MRTTDRRDLPAYPLSEAARYTKVAPATLRTWVAGRRYPRRDGGGFFRPLIRMAAPDSRLLSFNNLVEAHVLRALRTEHGVPIPAVRTALEYAQQALQIERLLLSKELLAGAGQIFLEQYGSLINLSRSGQLAMQRVLAAYLDRVEWDAAFPVRLYPFVSTDADTRRPISIDPEVAFGRPTLARTGVSTESIVQRIDAGESVHDLAMDYDVTPQEVEEAVLYERAA